MILPEVGEAGQRRLAQSSVLIVGAGGLGSPAALYLAAAGVGRIEVVDFDAVDVTNLHRQVLFGDEDVGRRKVEVAAQRLLASNPDIEVVVHDVRLGVDNAREIVGGVDLVVDGSDTFATKYLVNDACILERVPNVYASVLRFDGEISVFGVRGGPCYRCLYPSPPDPGHVPTCAEAGVLGAVPGVLGALQAGEAMKLLLDIGTPLVGRLLRYDALAGSFRTFELARDPACPVCGDAPTQHDLLPDYHEFCGSGEREEAAEISVEDLRVMMARGERPFLLDVRTPREYDRQHIGGTLIPLQELEERLDELEGRRDQPMVVYCRTGARSTRAVELLRERGFRHAVNLVGGIEAWNAANEAADAR